MQNEEITVVLHSNLEISFCFKMQQTKLNEVQTFKIF